MTQIYPIANFDYINQRINITVQSDQGSWGSITASLIAPEGYIVGTTTITPSSFHRLQARGTSSIPMYVTYSSFGCLKDPSTTQFYFSEPISNLHINSDFVGVPGLQDILIAYETGSIQPGISLSQTDDAYNGLPVVLNRGTNTAYLKISSVSGSNHFTYTSSNISSVALNAADFTNYVGLGISGTASGINFAVTADHTSVNGVYIDRDCSTWSGSIVKLCPYRYIVDYSGWDTYDGTTNTNINALFTVNQSMAEDVGTLVGTMQYNGDTTVDVGSFYGFGSTPYTINVASYSATLADDLKEDILLGDVVDYRINGASTARGVVASVSKTGPDFTIYIYPTGGVPITVAESDFEIKPQNIIELHTHPKFNSDYLLFLESGNSTHSSVVRTPSAELEVSANDFESTYSSVGEISHFHIGPVHLSNGQVLKDGRALTLSGALYQGNVTTTTPITTWLTHGTRTTDVGLINNGVYLKNGVFTTTYSQAFNASETLYLEVEAIYGASKINRIISIPVQPSI